MKNEMPIAFVDRQLNDNSREVNLILAKAASSCCRSMVKSGSSSRPFFMSESIMTNALQNIINKIDRFHQNDENCDC